MNFKLVLPSIVFLISVVSKGQEASNMFGLEDAVNYALEHNKTLQNEKDNVKLAGEQYKESRASGLPSVDGSFDYMTYFNYELNFSFGAPGAINEDMATEALRATMLKYPDWNVSDYLAAQEYESTLQGMMPSSNIVMGDQVTAGISVSQLLFSGQYWVGLQLAKQAKTLRETSYQISELDVKEQAVNAYYLILSTEQILKYLKESEQNLEEIFKHTGNMVQAGMAEQTDADQVWINLSEVKNSTKNMELTRELTYNSFKFILGLDSDTDVILTDSLDVFLQENENILSSLDSFSLSSNPTYTLLEQQEELGAKQVDLNKWAYAPTLAAFYSYSEKIVTSGFDLSPKNAAGLTMSIPIFSGGAKRAKVSQSKIELEQIRRNKSLVEDQLQLQYNQLSYELTNAYNNYKTQKQNVKVAERVYNNLQNKYRQGMLSSFELTQASASYISAQSNYVSASLSLLQAKLALDKLYNNI